MPHGAYERCDDVGRRPCTHLILGVGYPRAAFPWREIQLGTTKVDNFRYFAGKLRTLRKTTPFDEGSNLNKFQTKRLCHWPTNRDLLVEGAQNIGHPSFLPLNSSKNGF